MNGAYEERKGTERFLVGKSDQERLLGRCKQRWEDNSKINQLEGYRLD